MTLALDVQFGVYCGVLWRCFAKVGYRTETPRFQVNPKRYHAKTRILLGSYIFVLRQKGSAKE